MSVQSITPQSTGIFDVRTAGGTSLVLELDTAEAHVTRKPGMARPTAGFDEPRRLPGDFTRQPLTERPTITVGGTVALNVLAGDAPARIETAPILTIEEI